MKPVAIAILTVGMLARGLAAAANSAASTDWPQFRGPNRDGVAPGSPKLAVSWPTNGPALLWKSEWEGGRGGRACGASSPVVADGKVFVYVNQKLPKDGGKNYKPITTELLIDSGWRPDLPEELARKIEAARLGRPHNEDTTKYGGWQKVPPGAPIWFGVVAPTEAEIDAFLAKTPDLDKYIKDFVATLEPQDTKTYGAYIKRRFSMFLCEYTWDELVQLSKLRDKEFVSFDQWRPGDYADNTLKKDANDNWQHGCFSMSAFLRSCKMSDTLACLDAATGKTLWKQDFPVDLTIFNREGMSWSPHGGFDNFGVSSVPTIAGGKCYFAGAMGLYCLSARDGALLWKVPGDPEHASPLVASGIVYHCGAAYDAETGKLLWKNPNYKPNWTPWYQTHQRFSSPQLWTSGDTNYIITTDARRCCLLDLKTGRTLWTAVESIFQMGVMTPVLCGDILVGATTHGLSFLGAIKVTPSGPQPLWSRKDTFGAFGLLVDPERVYCYGEGNGVAEWRCVDLQTGADVWSKRMPAGYSDVFSTPVLVDGKIINIWGSGHFSATGYDTVELLTASPEGYVQLVMAKLTLKIAGMSSPAIANGHLFLRLQDGGVACYDLRAK